MMKTKKKSVFKDQKLTNKSIVELKQLLKKTQAEWMKLKMDLKIDKLKDVCEPRKKQKEIAIIKTIISEKILNRSSNHV